MPPLKPHYAVNSQAGSSAGNCRIDAEKRACPALPAPPLKNLSFNSVYEENDPSRSEIDPEAFERYKKRTRRLRQFENKLSGMANAYLESDGQSYWQADCVLDWLSAWAGGDALLGRDNSQGQFVRQWTLATLSSAYVQVRNDPGLDPEKKKTVDAWLGRIAQKVIDSYPSRTEATSKQNNHLYWGAWAVAITGAALNNRDFYEWGINKAKLAIYAHIQPDGTLPLEMTRGKRALRYHIFSLTPLVMLAELGERNGDHLYEIGDHGIHRLVNRVLIGMDDPSFFEEKTGSPQEPVEGMSPGHFSWMEPYNNRFPDPRIDKWLQHYRPVIARRTGGDMTMLYSHDR